MHWMRPPKPGSTCQDPLCTLIYGYRAPNHIGSVEQRVDGGSRRSMFRVQGSTRDMKKPPDENSLRAVQIDIELASVGTSATHLRFSV